MFATSPDHKGLLVAGYSEEDLNQKLPHALHDLYAATDRYITRSVRTEAGIEIEFYGEPSAYSKATERT